MISYVTGLLDTFGSFWGKPTPPPLTKEQEARVDLIWKQFQQEQAPYTKPEVAAGISLVGRVTPGRYSKAEVAKLTNEILGRPMAIGEEGEVFFLEKTWISEGRDKHVYGMWVALGNRLVPAADLTVRRNLNEALQEIGFTRQINSQYVMKILMSAKYEAPHLVEKEVIANKLFIAQERMDGTLSALAQDPKATLKERFSALIQTAKGVRDLHQRGIAHNDLHWENVLFRRVDDRLEVKVTDLGRAGELDKMGQANDDYHLGVLITRMFYEDSRFRFPNVSGLEKKVLDLVQEITSTDVEYPPPTEEILNKLEALASEYPE